MIKKKFYFLLAAIILMACISSCSGDNEAEEIDEAIQEYITDNSIDAQVTSSGLYYEINNEGTGEQAISSNLAIANLRGSLVDGSEWLNTDSGRSFRSLLSNTSVIPGVIEGLRLMKTGQEATLIMPPSLGFGDVAFSGIPANSILIIEVSDLVIYEDVDAMNQQLLRQYISDNELMNVDSTDTGLYFTTDDVGEEGSNPTSTSSVRVNYTGYFLDGTVFDTNEEIEFSLDQVIEGWTEGLQLYREGSSGTMMIPSDLAYGALGNESIPPHTPLIFDIELLEVID